jgi:streptomycin 3"-adenylyltransferase
MSSQPIAHEHERGRPQSWETADAEIRAFVEESVSKVGRELERSGFVGAYLHGSLAMGSFYRPKSDIDVLFVVEDRLDPDSRRDLAEVLCDCSDGAPAIGDLEVSVIRRSDARNFRQPLPYEVHLGENLKASLRDGSFDFTRERTDPDLAAHCTAVRARGVVLRGQPIGEVFGPVPSSANRSAILGDLAWILEDDHMIESPYYGVLNCCRVLELTSTGWNGVFSKEEGGEWALEHLPEQYHPVVAQALACYRSPTAVPPEKRRTDGHDWDESALHVLRDYVAIRMLTS